MVRHVPLSNCPEINTVPRAMISNGSRRQSEVLAYVNEILIYISRVWVFLATWKVLVESCTPVQRPARSDWEFSIHHGACRASDNINAKIIHPWCNVAVSKFICTYINIIFYYIILFHILIKINERFKIRFYRKLRSLSFLPMGKREHVISYYSQAPQLRAI